MSSMSTSALARIDSLLDRQVARLEKIEAQQAAEREEARRARMRDAMYERTEIGSRYADAFRSFGTEVPAPVDDEPPSRYRARLFNRLARKLPEGHEWASTRADDLPLGGVMDNIEKMVLEAAKAEGERPSQENLPTDGAMVARTRTDADTGGKVTEWFGKESFVKDFTRPGRRVLRLIDPRSGRVLLGEPFSSR
jgi:hypothetical protein